MNGATGGDNRGMSRTSPVPVDETFVSPYSHPSVAGFAGRGVRVLLINVVLVLVMSYVTGHLSLEQVRRAMVYGAAISLLSWAFIDMGRFVVGFELHSGWPRGFWGVALPVVGCGLGFALGSAAADLVNGYPLYSSYRLGLRSLKADLLGSMLIGAAFSGYYYLRGRNAHQQARLARTERDLSLARLHMLQAQLEPHMLFNTLANLRVLIGIDPPRAQAMLDRMIAYLRATLDGSRATAHPLAAEFERLADYLALMAVRMGPRLQVRFDLPEALRGVPVPPMLLQPLVENCIKHGLEPKVAGGAVEVSARRVGDTLELRVRDTGAGLAEAGFRRTDAEAGFRQAGAEAGFGVRQVRERLDALYGPKATLSLGAADDERGGTLARVVLPLPPSTP
jgi:hypothetical protein